jgi:hypothetical protein
VWERREAIGERRNRRLSPVGSDELGPSWLGDNPIFTLPTPESRVAYLQQYFALDSLTILHPFIATLLHFPPVISYIHLPCLQI